MDRMNARPGGAASRLRARLPRLRANLPTLRPLNTLGKPPHTKRAMRQERRLLP